MGGVADLNENDQVRRWFGVDPSLVECFKCDGDRDRKQIQRSE